MGRPTRRRRRDLNFIICSLVVGLTEPACFNRPPIPIDLIRHNHIQYQIQVDRSVVSGVAMHNNRHHHAVAAGGANGSSRGGSSRRGGAGAGGERRLGALEAVALGIVFIVGVSFGMYLEGRQHHDELQSFASPKVCPSRAHDFFQFVFRRDVVELGCMVDGSPSSAANIHNCSLT